MSGKSERGNRKKSKTCVKDCSNRFSAVGADLTKDVNHNGDKYKSSQSLVSSHTNLKPKCFECKECKKKYFSKSFFQRHIAKHNAQNNCEENSLTIESQPEIIEKECHICVKICTPRRLEGHICSHINTKYYSCKECESQFSSKKLLRQHLDIHYNQHVCEMCNKKFRNAYLQKHHTCINGKLKTHICETCGKGCASTTYLKIHMRTHTKETPYLCDKCDRRFMHNAGLRNHYRKHLGEDVDNSDILRTGNTFVNKPKSDKGDTYKPHFTQLKTYSNKKGTGYGKKRVTCDICEKSFYDNYCLERHMRIHKNERPYMCDICSKAFTQKSNLHSHYRSHSDVISRFPCDICDKTFVSKNSLYEHTLIHANKKPFACKFCNKSYLRKHRLEAHIRLHTGEKPFKCEECEKSFSCKYRLQTHEKKHKEPQHICSICNKVFFDIHYFNQHLRSHIKPYTCDICHKGFSYLNLLERHYLWHTSMKVSNTKDLNKGANSDQESHLNDCKISDVSNQNELTYVCKVCKSVFLKKENLVRHQKESMQKGYYKCCACFQVYNNKMDLLAHLSDHKSLMNGIISSSDKPCQLEMKLHECQVCKKAFETESCFESHKKKFYKENNFKCCLCLQVYSDQNGLFQHNIRHIVSQVNETVLVADQSSELADKTFECKICKKIFLNELSLSCHIDEFYYKSRFSCCKCRQLFDSCEDLLEHYNIHHTSEQENNCSSSSKSFESEEKHMCKVCKKLFLDEKELKCHTGELYKDGSFKCCMCQQVFCNNESLLEHCNVHNNVNNTLLRAFMPVFDTNFTLKEENFLISDRTNELERKPYVCEICKQVFSNATSFKYHSDEISQEDSYKCCLCYQIFNDKKLLLEHCSIHIAVPETPIMYSETESKPIFCEICKNNFESREMLDRHNNEFMREGNFKCCMCHQGYRIKEHLLIHYKEHEFSLNENNNSSFGMFDKLEEKPYLCKVCRKCFSNKTMLASHYDEYIREGNFSCCMCKQIYSGKEVLLEHHKIHDKLTEKPYVCFLKATI